MGQHTLSLDDIAPLLDGLAIMGTGGGGSPLWGKAILEHEFEAGRLPKLTPIEEIPDEALIVSGGIMGSVKVLERIGIDKVISHWEERFELLDAVRVMEAILGRSVDYVVPFELGGLNTPVVLSLAARMGIPAVDGDGVGRAAPETHMASFIGHGVSLTPMPLVDFQGNVVIVREATEPTYADELGRWVITKGGGLGANSHYPMTGHQAKQAIIPNTVTGTLELGRALARARNEGRDPVHTVVSSLGGQLLFTGNVQRLVEKESMGFYYTVGHIQGTGTYAGSLAELTIKNETMLLSVDRKVLVLFPDLICMLDPQTGRGVMSIELAEGSPLALVGVPCHARLRQALHTEVGAVAFSPARYGYPDLEFTPMETPTGSP